MRCLIRRTALSHGYEPFSSIFSVRCPLAQAKYRFDQTIKYVTANIRNLMSRPEIVEQDHGPILHGGVEFGGRNRLFTTKKASLSGTKVGLQRRLATRSLPLRLYIERLPVSWRILFLYIELIPASSLVHYVPTAETASLSKPRDQSWPLAKVFHSFPISHFGSCASWTL